LFRQALGRNPGEPEMRLLEELHSEQLKIFQQDPLQASAFLKVGDLAAPADMAPVELAAATVLANALLNLDEAITLR
jgi:hypothetical protein